MTDYTGNFVFEKMAMFVKLRVESCMSSCKCICICVVWNSLPQSISCDIQGFLVGMSMLSLEPP